MIINGYETTVGKPLKVKDHIHEVIKMLAIRNDLLPTTKAGVFTLDKTNGLNIPIFPLPITLDGYDKKIITVYDERPFRNESNKVISKAELNVIRLSAYLQQDGATNQFSTLTSSKFICMKGVGGALAQFIITRYGLDMTEGIALRIIIGHYINCLFEGDGENTGYISANALKTAFNIGNNISQYMVDDIGYLGNMIDLLTAIKTEPTLFKIKNISLAELIGLAGRLSYVGIGGKIVSVMLESPFLMVGFCYASVVNKGFFKTPIGLQLDVKYNKDLVETFIRNISYNYDLSDVS